LENIACNLDLSKHSDGAICGRSECLLTQATTPPAVPRFCVAPRARTWPTPSDPVGLWARHDWGDL